MSTDNRPPKINNSSVGSGTDQNSDLDRLRDHDNRQDKVGEDTFPASDAPARSPVIGVGGSEPSARGPARTEAEALRQSGLPADFKDNPEAQFNYGRKSEQSTLHFDRDSKRLYRGNPDIGEVDLGTIEADRPASPDDNDSEPENVNEPY